jgi:hypothetical protein
MGAVERLATIIARYGHPWEARWEAAVVPEVPEEGWYRRA